jgi:hypothetical protein
MNLAGLDRLERAVAGYRDPTRTEDEACVFDNLRPLLDLVAQMGRGLEEVKPMAPTLGPLRDAIIAWEQVKGGSDAGS